MPVTRGLIVPADPAVPAVPVVPVVPAVPAVPVVPVVPVVPSVFGGVVLPSEFCHLAGKKVTIGKFTFALSATANVKPDTDAPNVNSKARRGIGLDNYVITTYPKSSTRTKERLETWSKKEYGCEFGLLLTSVCNTFIDALLLEIPDKNGVTAQTAELTKITAEYGYSASELAAILAAHKATQG